MGVNCRPARLAEPHQRQVATLGHLNRQCGSGGYGKQDLDPTHCRLLHHLVRRRDPQRLLRAGGDCARPPAARVGQGTSDRGVAALAAYGGAGGRRQRL